MDKASPAIRQRVGKGEKSASALPRDAEDDENKRPMEKVAKAAVAPASWYGKVDVVLVIVFAVLAACTRFYNISDPPSIVFDEEVRPPTSVLAYSSAICLYHTSCTKEANRAFALRHSLSPL